MDQPPSISILIATYNTPFPLVKRALNSVWRQTNQDFEVILVDDGSTRDPQNQLFNLCKGQEERLLFLRQKNQGQSRAINRAVSLSSGRYLSILDADDEYMPEHLQACLEQMDSYDLIASTTRTIVTKEEDYFVTDRHQPNRLIHVDDCILFATLFGKREVFKRKAFIDGYAADADFFEWAKKRFKVGKVDLRTYVYYRNHPDSTCERMKIKFSGKKENASFRQN
ncbi:glycosyltransferase family 2 protein [Cyclobacterium jeungdonense]|uniref:Glycosyltransferase family A protein n=1 Tax=Cyclobacterium jeungdonense TaxID=708087 RepID=A0ABT8CB57_9BACT|nr:glycosyltransferase family A protein [Cyclobacterium jeungdonense]MDN3688995.1 glycosyltransferase family A protein [Cyclobacterium jeungdonense]